MECPKCRHQTTEAATECPACGVVLSKATPARSLHGEVPAVKPRAAPRPATTQPAPSVTPVSAVVGLLRGKSPAARALAAIAAVGLMTLLIMAIIPDGEGNLPDSNRRDQRSGDAKEILTRDAPALEVNEIRALVMKDSTFSRPYVAACPKLFAPTGYTEQYDAWPICRHLDGLGYIEVDRAAHTVRATAAGRSALTDRGSYYEFVIGRRKILRVASTSAEHLAETKDANAVAIVYWRWDPDPDAGETLPLNLRKWGDKWVDIDSEVGQKGPGSFVGDALFVYANRRWTLFKINLSESVDVDYTKPLDPRIGIR